MPGNVDRRLSSAVAIAVIVSSIFFIAAGTTFYAWVSVGLKDIRDELSTHLAKLSQDHETMASRISINNNSMGAIHAVLIKLREERIEEREREVERRDNVEKRITDIAIMLESGVRRQEIVHGMMLRFLPPSWREELQKSMEADKETNRVPVPDTQQPAISSEKL